MFSSDFSGKSLGKHIRKINKMSYMFGPHSTRDGDRIYFTGDRRIVEQDPTGIEIKPHATPAWVIADYMLSKSRGEPLTDYEEMLISQSFESEGLRWLRQYLREA
tara:strand:- start:1816 stop:2130 length:315 start_codon:yes stop_codon:yes gene_type:complete